MDDKVQRGEQWLGELLDLAKLPTSVKAGASQIRDDGSCWLEIDDAALSEEQATGLIGDRGSVLDAVQYLINTTLNLGKGDEDQQHYTIELRCYREQRQAELKQIADEAAQQVLETGEPFEIASLSSAERRQVHTYLKDYEGLKTESQGQEPDRRLVVQRV